MTSRGATCPGAINQLLRPHQLSWHHIVAWGKRSTITLSYEYFFHFEDAIRPSSSPELTVVHISVLHSMEKHWAPFWKWAPESTKALLYLPTFLYCFLESEGVNEVWLSCSKESAEKFLMFSTWKYLCFLMSCRRGGWANRGTQHLFGINNG